MKNKNRKKIVHVIDSLAFGGAQVILKELFVSQKGNKKIFLYSIRKKGINIKINHPNVFFSSSKCKYSITPLFELKKLITDNRIEILHCHLFKSFIFSWILKIFYFPNLKLIFHEHGRIFKNSFFYNIFLKISTSAVNLYISISGATKESLIKKAGIKRNKIKTIYNFVSPLNFSGKGRKKKKTILNKFKIKEKDFTVGFASRIIKRKGWKEFILAAEIIIKKNENIKFLIAGDGKEKKELEDLIGNKGLDGKVFDLGYVSNMAQFYSSLDCFVVPSHWEPMGLTELEAQSMGLPVIASDVPALNEIIYDKINGLLFEAKNQEDLSKKILIIRRNKKLSNEKK